MQIAVTPVTPVTYYKNARYIWHTLSIDEVIEVEDFKQVRQMLIAFNRRQKVKKVFKSKKGKIWRVS